MRAHTRMPTDTPASETQPTTSLYYTGGKDHERNTKGPRTHHTVPFLRRGRAHGRAPLHGCVRGRLPLPGQAVLLQWVLRAHGKARHRGCGHVQQQHPLECDPVQMWRG